MASEPLDRDVQREAYRLERAEHRQRREEQRGRSAPSVAKPTLDSAANANRRFRVAVLVLLAVVVGLAVATWQTVGRLFGL